MFKGTEKAVSAAQDAVLRPRFSPKADTRFCLEGARRVHRKGRFSQQQDKVHQTVGTDNEGAARRKGAKHPRGSDGSTWDRAQDGIHHLTRSIRHRGRNWYSSPSPCLYLLSFSLPRSLSLSLSLSLTLFFYLMFQCILGVILGVSLCHIGSCDVMSYYVVA